MIKTTENISTELIFYTMQTPSWIGGHIGGSTRGIFRDFEYDVHDTQPELCAKIQLCTN
ncbi:MAG TPA: hypothetical protein VKR58_00800 [Aquella sp.]|nr:hypothetical protein [Aquella sp.]